MNSEYI